MTLKLTSRTTYFELSEIETLALVEAALVLALMV